MKTEYEIFHKIIKNGSFFFSVIQHQLLLVTMEFQWLSKDPTMEKLVGWRHVHGNESNIVSCGNIIVHLTYL